MGADMGGDDRKSLWDQNSSWWSEQYTTRYDADYEGVILPFVCDALRGFRKIIDIGGGEGRLSRYLIEQNGSDVISTDFSLFQLIASKGQEPIAIKVFPMHQPDPNLVMTSCDRL